MKSSSIADKIGQIKQSLPVSVSLVAVSKFHPVEVLQEAYAAGQRIFGESKAQELVPKYEKLPKDIEWHFIGHLQENKVKYIAPFVSLIHSVDNFKLLKEIDKQAAKNNRVISCLLELFVAQEETKYGLSFEECRALLADPHLQELTHIQIKGIMGMASLTDDETQIRQEFRRLHQFFLEMKEIDLPNVSIRELSMGMSHDYLIAVEEGSTMVRVGTILFGEREY